VRDEKRNADDIQILLASGDILTIKTPSGEEVNNFAVDDVKQTSNGFEIEVEYGSRYKYEKTFIFEHGGKTFNLTQIKVKSFDGADPEKSSERSVIIKPPVALEEFKIDKYLSD